MKFLFIFGPQAVGKMSVGEILSKKLDLPLLYNHVTLDVIWPYIGWNETTFKLSDELRLGIFDYISKDPNHKGIIFTFVWSFDSVDDWAYIEQVKSLFNQEHHELYFIELEADIVQRLIRNKSENRLLKKPSKRDVEYSENELLTSLKKHRLNSYPNEVKEKNYLKIDTTYQSVEQTSTLILNWLEKLSI